MSTDRPLVTTVATEAAPEPAVQYQRALLRPSTPTPARTGQYYQRQARAEDLRYILPSAARSQYLAVDFETRGTDYSWGYEGNIHSENHRGVTVVGIGLAWDRGSAYIHLEGLDPYVIRQVLALLATHPHILAHNYYFDGGVLRVLLDYYGVPQRDPALGHTASCTLALYQLLSNEGWAGQKHGLKDAMVDILLWDEANDRGIDVWLVRNGYYKGNRRVDNDPDYLLSQYEERDAKGKRKLQPDKAEMWRVPRDILGEYCVKDAEACYLLYTEQLLPVARRFPALLEFFLVRWMYHIEVHITQKEVGMLLDKEAVRALYDSLSEEIDTRTRDFLSHPEVSGHIHEIEKGYLAELAAKEPARYKKVKPRPPEPPRETKKGLPSKAHAVWVANAGKYLPQISLNWENWRARWEKAVSGQDPDYRFNPNSDKQLIELLYERLGYPITVTTDSGLPGTGADALRHMGEVGKILVDRDEATKRRSFYEKYLELVEERDTVHPGFRLPGPCTGRLSSNNINVQQVPKSKTVMSLFRAPPGTVWGDLDFRALENVVAAELTECPNLYNLYGDDVPENDAHLFLAAHVPSWKEEIAATGYTPYNPKPGSVDAAKKLVKSQRSKAKSVVYCCQYGGGAQKVYETMTNDGVDITFDEVKEIHTLYWELYDRVKKYGYELQDQWWENLVLDEATKKQYRYWSKSKHTRDRIPPGIASYVLNGLGRPMCVTYDYIKDLLSRVLQSTGHDILVEYCYIFGHELDEREIPWTPVIFDLHDATTVQVPEEYGEPLLETFSVSMDKLNVLLGGKIRHGGTPVLGTDLAMVKEPESD